MNIASQVIEIISEQALLKPEEITLDSSPADLGIDSLGLVEAIFAIEERFDISVPFNVNAPQDSDFDISSVATIVQGIQALIAKQG